MKKKKKILLVEDNPDDAELVLLSMESKKIESDINIINNGEQALDFLMCKGQYINRDINDLPDLVLLDLKLPKKSGVEVLKEIRKNETTKYLPVVIFTSSNMEQDIKQCYINGANSFVRKPVDFNYFQTAIEKLSNYWLVLNEKYNLE
ncbi:MAG: response regulator [Salinivirgaceae bacterium]|nr:response regulator [Salinivirgaceae bacterium]